MNTKVIRLIVALSVGFIILTSGGCATYSPVKSPYTQQKCGLEVALPSGWLQFVPAKKCYMMTRDGLRLEAIVIKLTRVNDKIEGTERVYQANMLPQELADLSFGLIKAQEGVKNASLERVERAVVAGQDGYKADATYVDGSGLPVRLRMYGAVVNGYVCEFSYNAADPVYFSKYEKDFESLVASAKVKS
jgi:uncharacterized protein YerC